MEYLDKISSYNKSNFKKAEAANGQISDENLPARLETKKRQKKHMVSANSKLRNGVDTHKLITRKDKKVKQGRKIKSSNCLQSYEVHAFKDICRKLKFNVLITVNPSSEIFYGDNPWQLKKRREWIERYISSLIRSIKARGHRYKAIKVYERFEGEGLHVHILALIEEENYDLLENRSGTDQHGFRQFEWKVIPTAEDLWKISNYLMKGRKHFGKYDANFQNRTGCKQKKGHMPIPGFSRMSASKDINKAWKHCLKSQRHRYLMLVEARLYNRQNKNVKTSMKINQVDSTI